jgi:CBS domain-containing protein
MNIEQVMTRNVKTCAIHSTLDDAARIMWDRDCGSVPVVDEEQRVVGMITDRDICMSAWSQGRPLVELRVANAMSPRIHTCKPLDSIESAEEIMRKQQVRRLPVIDPDGRLLGILSLTDIAIEAACGAQARNKSITAREVGETLAGVCQSRGKGERALEAVPRSAATTPSNNSAKQRANFAASH